MTPEEKEQLEKEYPQFDWDRMKRALIYCIIIMVAASFFV